MELTETLTYGNKTINETIIFLNKTATEWQWAYENENNMKWFFIITTLLALAFFLLLKKQFKTNKENKEKIEKLSQEVLEEFKKLSEGYTDEKGKKHEKVNEIDIRDLPKPIQDNILNSPSILSKMFFSTKGEKTGYKPPFLLLIRSDMTGEIMHNAKEGILKLKKKDKDKTEVLIHLSSQKLIDLKVKGKYLGRFWIQFEDEAESYPITPKHHSMILYQIVHKLQMTKGLIEGKKGKFPKILIVIGIVAIIGGIAAYYYFGKKTPTTSEVQTAVTVANETFKNFTNNVTMQVKV